MKNSRIVLSSTFVVNEVNEKDGVYEVVEDISGLVVGRVNSIDEAISLVRECHPDHDDWELE